jgi:DNA-binding NarL/FixJ family response regulator
VTVIRLLIADDHPIVLAGLKGLFEDTAGFDVVASCRDGLSAVESIEQLQPDVAVLDLRMPGMNGIEVLRELKRKGLDTRTVILAATIDEIDAVEAMRLGAKGLILKEMAPTQLLSCVRKVHAGEQWIEKHAVGRAIERLIAQTETTTSLRALLTERELTIMKLVAEGMSGKEVAGKLGITYGTVKSHLHSIYSKLGVKGRVGLMNYARQRRLV